MSHTLCHMLHATCHTLHAAYCIQHTATHHMLYTSHKTSNTTQALLTNVCVFLLTVVAKPDKAESRKKRKRKAEEAESVLPDIDLSK